MGSQRSSDAPQNLGEFRRWRQQKEAYALDDWYLDRINRKWRTIGKLAKDPSALRGIEDHN
jgi:hypothetical protein